MLNIFHINSVDNVPFLSVYINNELICKISSSGLPREKRISIKLPGSRNELIFVDHTGKRNVHSLKYEKGWLHLSIRVHQNLTCQADCIVSDEKKYDKKDFSSGELKGIRFQPFFIAGAKNDDLDLAGKGLFERGFHFSGVITPGNVSLSCICDNCKKSFRINSFHAGLSDGAYFYSGSGLQTLFVSTSVAGAPPAFSKPDKEKLLILETQLPLARDGTRFKYMNSFRCPYCGAAYIDFERFPEQRESEYYGNYFYDDIPMQYEP